MLSIEDFQPVKLEDKALFDKHYKKYPPVHSDNVFTTMISWMEYSNYHYTFVDESLLIYTKIGNKIRFRPPIGKRKKEIFDQVVNLAKKENSDYPLGVIDKETKVWIQNNYPNFKFRKHRDFFDYIYLSKDLAELKGSDYSKIRNRLNKFERRNKYTIENIRDENFKEIKDFLHRWCLWKDCESDEILEQEKKAIFYSMDHFFDLKLKGISFRINDKVESIAVWEKMNPNTAVIHYEKGNPDIDGIYKAINQQTAKIINKDLTYINRESDMGIPGLRKAKLSYRPHHMIEVFHVARNDLRV
jgi:hypothetical protein